MFAIADPFSAGNCRTAIVPVCDTVIAPTTTTVLSAGDFQIRLRDSLDFTVDFSQWLAANGSALLTAATFSVASGSPETPILVGQSFAPGGACVVVISPAMAAVLGDTYWIDIAATVGATNPANSGEVAIPPRHLTRRINIVVVNG